MNLFNFWKNSSVKIPGIPEYFNKDQEKRERLERYVKSWEAYLAELPDPILDDSEYNNNTKVNPARAIVNVGVFFLFGNGVKFEESPDMSERLGKAASHTVATTGKVVPPWLSDLNACWEANRKESFLMNMGLSGAIHGDVVIELIPNGAGEMLEFPRVLLHDPANIDADTDPNDCEKVVRWTIEYITYDVQGDPICRIKEIAADQDENDVIQSWTIQHYEQQMSYIAGTGWTPNDQPKVKVGSPVLWPYSWAPIEHCQNLELPHMFWGLPDLDASSIEVIESLQRTKSSLNKIINIHAAPRMWAKNVMPDQVDDIDVSADNIITLPNMESELHVLTMIQNISPSVDHAKGLKEDLYEMVQVPPIALGQLDTTASSMSGIQQSILYSPIVQKTALKRISYGDMLKRLNRKLLILMGHENTKEYRGLTVVWPESMPGSAYLERQTIETDHQLGVSKYTTLTKLGYDGKEEEVRRLDEMEAELKLQEKYTAKPEVPGQSGPGAPKGNQNNSSGYGNKNGSMGGTKGAGKPKTPNDDSNK
jgi:hypothetical protein